MTLTGYLQHGTLLRTQGHVRKFKEIVFPVYPALKGQRSCDRAKIIV